jgi:uncharacterized membrane protein YqhA
VERPVTKRGRLRTVIAAICFGLAAALVVLAGKTLSTIWADYKDSADSVYIEVAAVELLLAVPFLAGSYWALRDK